jgi:hypothetical protein
VCRAEEGAALLLHLHHLHQGALGGRDHPGGLHQRVQGPTQAGICESRDQANQEHVSLGPKPIQNMRVQGPGQSGICDSRAQANQEYVSPGPRPIRNM